MNVRISKTQTRVHFDQEQHAGGSRMVSGFGFRVSGLGSRVSGFGVRCSDFGGWVKGAPAAFFHGGNVFEAGRLLYHSTLGLRVIKKKKKKYGSHKEDVPCTSRVQILLKR